MKIDTLQEKISSEFKFSLFRLNDKFPTFNSDHSYIFKNLAMMAYITKIHK